MLCHPLHLGRFVGRKSEAYSAVGTETMAECMRRRAPHFSALRNWTAPRVRAHALLCMLAYYLEWHMHRTLAPILLDDHDRATSKARRVSPGAKAQPSPAAKRKAKTKQIEDGLPVHSFRSLLADLATLTRNTVRCGGAATFAVLATPTQIRRRGDDSTACDRRGWCAGIAAGAQMGGEALALCLRSGKLLRKTSTVRGVRRTSTARRAWR
jgi:hypothetical protein